MELTIPITKLATVEGMTTIGATSTIIGIPMIAPYTVQQSITPKKNTTQAIIVMGEKMTSKIVATMG
jgi:hypothetical protein